MQESRPDCLKDRVAGSGQGWHPKAAADVSDSVVILGRSRLGRGAHQAIIAACRASVGRAEGGPGRARWIVATGTGPLALLSCLYRTFSRHATFLAYVGEPLPQPAPWRWRLILSRADGVLVDGHATSVAVALPKQVTHRIGSTGFLGRFLQVTPASLPAMTKRLVVVGNLTPGSGAFDLLAALATWAEANGDHDVALDWVGEGDLSGMLAAQPLPRNLSQRFRAVMDEQELATLFEQGGLLAVPCVADDGSSHVAEALASGLPVIGSRRNREVRRHVTDGVNGWLFDPLRPGAMLDVMSRALATGDDQLAEMRSRARAAMSVPLAGAALFDGGRRPGRSSASLHLTAPSAR